MAYIFLLNESCNQANPQYRLMLMLAAAGWTRMEDSDGTTYSSSGTQITTATMGAGGLENAGAWWRLRAPATNGGLIVNQRREIVFQNSGVGGRSWRLKYSASAGFVIGSPGATQTPEAADEVYMIGGGTDAAPTYTTNWAPPPSPGLICSWHICCGGAAEDYSFYAFAITPVFATHNGMFLDVMRAGSFSSTDVDPAVMYVSGAEGSGVAYGSNTTFAFLGGNLVNATNPAFARAWMGATSAAKAAIVGTNSQRVAMIPYGSTSGVTLGGATTCAVNPFTANDDVLPAWYMRPGVNPPPSGFKGMSRLFRYGSVLRANMDTLDLVTPKDHVYIGGQAGTITQSIWQPWNGSTP